MKTPNFNCSTCSALIFVKPYVLSRSKSGKAYCSMSCYGISCRKEFPCPVCQKPVTASKNSKTCSRACANRQKIGMKYKGIFTKDVVRDKKALRWRVIADRGVEKCEECGYDRFPEAIHVHHVIPRAEGGSDQLSNLKLLCPNCHEETHIKLRRLKKLTY